MSRFGKKKIQEAAAPVELNIMPFIDVFSLLCTFLLFSAVFISIGIHMVQVPFLSNAAPSKEESKRSLQVKIDASPQKVEVTSSWSEAPVDSKTEAFSNSKEGLAHLHEALIKLRLATPEADKVDLFLDDDLSYAQIIDLLDVIKLRLAQDPALAEHEGFASSDLFPKVVFSSVIL